MCGETVVLTFSGKGWVEERRFDKCVMHASVTAAAIREQWAVKD